MNDEERLNDQRLADLTDALLARRARSGGARPGGAWPEGAMDMDGILNGETARLVEAIEVLAQVLEPQPPPGRLQRQLRRRIGVEWERARPVQARGLLGLFQGPAQRWAWAAVAAVVTIGIAVTLLLPPDAAGMSGTAAGGVGWILLAGGVVLLAGLAIAWFVSSRR